MAAPSTLQRELAALNDQHRLSAAVADVDQLIEMLSAARDQVATCKIPLFRHAWPRDISPRLTETFTALDPHTASLTMTKLQNPIKERFEAVNEDLRKVSRLQKDFGKALDKVLHPDSPLVHSQG
jgi:hypothetical protein